MKILFFSFAPETEPQAVMLKSLWHEVEFYDCHKNPKEENLFKLKHFQMYSRLLDYADENGFDILYHHDYLSVPEFMLSELKTRPSFKPRLIFQVMLREASRSSARSWVLKELLNMPQVAYAISFSLSIKDFLFPEKMISVGTNFSKIHMMPEPFCDENNFDTLTRKEARQHLNLSEDDFVVLWTGRWIYSKGADLFVEAAKEIDPDCTILAQTNPTEFDLPLSLLDELKKNHPKTIFINRYFPRGTMKYVYKASDLVVCSHRRLYEYASTGIVGLAALAHIPIVAPYFPFFSDVMDQYELGVSYLPENPADMAKAINYSIRNYGSVMKNARFKEYCDTYVNFEDITRIALEGLK